MASLSECHAKTCVSVILKSNQLDHDDKNVRLESAAKKMYQVEQLASSYSLRFSHRTRNGEQIRLDYCFHQPTEASLFYKQMISLQKSHSQPKLLYYIQTESELGYQHRAVLNEQDLLTIHSPVYCRNIFRTTIPIRVEQEEGTVAYHFNSVTDVNMFLFSKSNSHDTMTLGLLRMNMVPKKFVADDEGFYRLFTGDKMISPEFGEKHKFKIKPRLEPVEDSLLGGSLLLFSTEFDLFKFLVSDDAADLLHLTFDETKIIENSEKTGEKIDNSVSQEKCKDPFLNKRKEREVRDVVAENEKKFRVTRWQDMGILELEKKKLELERKELELERENLELASKNSKRKNLESKNLERKNEWESKNLELESNNSEWERKKLELEMKYKWGEKDKKEESKNRTEHSRDTTNTLGTLVLDRLEDEEAFATNKVTESVTTSDENRNQITSIDYEGSVSSTRPSLRTRTQITKE
eukprot:GFUD01017272.1.p1 GENE.GFUD01017272.1~~GFUD01017272.1.p1  ORF type:complete len:466 (+),score=146.61 GFUD01017272.1:40-1437(+)